MSIAVIIWQIVIFVSILIAGNLRPWVIGFWAVWTLIQVFTLPLSFLQFLTIFSAYIIASKPTIGSDSHNIKNAVPADKRPSGWLSSAFGYAIVLALGYFALKPYLNKKVVEYSRENISDKSSTHTSPDPVVALAKRYESAEKTMRLPKMVDKVTRLDTVAADGRFLRLEHIVFDDNLTGDMLRYSTDIKTSGCERARDFINAGGTLRYHYRSVSGQEIGTIVLNRDVCTSPNWMLVEAPAPLAREKHSAAPYENGVSYNEQVSDKQPANDSDKLQMNEKCYGGILIRNENGVSIQVTDAEASKKCG